MKNRKLLNRKLSQDVMDLTQESYNIACQINFLHEWVIDNNIQDKAYYEQMLEELSELLLELRTKLAEVKRSEVNEIQNREVES